MVTRIFDIKRDNQLIFEGTHFWCEACLIARPSTDKSPNPRYCRGCYELLLEESCLISKKKQPEWGEVIQFLDGWCWGITPGGSTVYCGKEDEVKEMLVNPDKRTGNKVIDGIINLEIQLRKENENEDTGRSIIRSSSSRAFQCRKANIRQPQIK